MILTDKEIIDLNEDGNTSYSSAVKFARAVEAAVLSKLAAGVSVEPAYLMSPDGKCYAPSKPPLSAGNAEGTLLTLYTAAAIAAARVQALDDAADIVDNAVTPDCGGWSTNGIAETVRALKGGAA